MKHDIATEADIRLLVERFYAKVRMDELLGGIFNAALAGRWKEHLDTMTGFWQTVLLNEQVYKGHPFTPHSRMPVDRAHFDRWKCLFSETVDSHFSGETAEEAKRRGALMAELFLSKIRFLREQ